MLDDESSASFSWGAITAGGILWQAMDPTFDTPGDAMQPGWWSNRVKYIHQVGVVGSVKFVSNGNHDFTGIFEGANYGLIRLSSAGKPGPSAPLTPGFGLKFLRDNRDSANLVAMNSVGGQKDDWDFFSKDATTHIPAIVSDALKILGWKFSFATDFI